MYNKLKAQWTGTMLALISIALLPIPILLYKFGKKLRGRSTMGGDES